MPANHEIIKSHCNICGGSRDHRLLYKKLKEYSEVDDDGQTVFETTDLYQFVECCGCSQLSLRHASWTNDPDDAVVSYYPAAVSRHMPSYLKSLNIIHFPMDVLDTVLEVYSALHHSLPRLAASGIRTVIDMVMTGEIGERRTFQDKLSAFSDAGYISKRQAEIVSSVIDAGGAAAHRGYQPTKPELDDLMDILESILASVYVHPHIGERIKKAVPPRKSVQSDVKKKE